MRVKGIPDGIPLIYFLNKLAPNKMVITNKARNIKNKTFAIEAAPSAIPPNPKMAAIIAITKKITDQRNIMVIFKGDTLLIKLSRVTLYIKSLYQMWF